MPAPRAAAIRTPDVARDLAWIVQSAVTVGSVATASAALRAVIE